MVPERSPERILVVDDSDATREVIVRHLRAVGYEPVAVTGVAEALDALARARFDLVVTDVRMPKVSGLDLVAHVRENHRDTEVTVVTGYPSVDGAVTAMKRGANDYLTKPFTREELLAAVERALDRVRARAGGASEPTALGRPHGVIGDSPAIRSVLAQVERAARAPATVLITGESGTGKELVARAIHYASARAAAPFVPVNCGGVPSELFESALFGHVRGAFTGATMARAGLFITADGGTLFLDEIAETSVAMQVKLLRVLQDKDVWMVGATSPRRVDVRVIAATNKDLPRMVARGAFREDLYYRLNVIAIDVPPLRARAGDVARLFAHFAARSAVELGCEPLRPTDAALDALARYDWPGNVRELENLVQRMTVMRDRPELDVADLPPNLRFAVAAPEPDLGRTLAEVERDYVRRVLASVDGNKTRAAEILGIDRKTLRARLAEPEDG
ncbi:MAG: sigma-54-dependent Fis family transcriptional regulator [Deltaproteobacteria bacterium]|nr:MAG: sigma-54-dependent Fis family transcriptional regulator [Deltaproteobacteria bacterium]